MITLTFFFDSRSVWNMAGSNGTRSGHSELLNVELQVTSCNPQLLSQATDSLLLINVIRIPIRTGFKSEILPNTNFCLTLLTLKPPPWSVFTCILFFNHLWDMVIHTPVSMNKNGIQVLILCLQVRLNFSPFQPLWSVCSETRIRC